MKIQVSKSNLEFAMKVVAGTSAGAGEELVSHFVFRCWKGTVEVLSNLLRVSSKAVLDCETSGVNDPEVSQMFTVEGVRLKQWVAAVPANSMITLQSTGGMVQATADKGRVSFTSLDTTSFRFWDAKIQDTKLTGTILASRLAKILKRTLPYVSPNETLDEWTCFCEFIEGSLWATDGASATVVRIPGLEGSNARLTGRKDISTCIRFLELHAEEDIEFLEHSEQVFLRCTKSGDTFTQGRWKNAFPRRGLATLAKAHDTAAFHWTFDRDEMVSAIDFIIPSAVREHYRMKIVPEEDTLQLSLVSAAGGEVRMPVVCTAQTETSEEHFPLVQGRVLLAYDYLRRMLLALPEGPICMAVHHSPHPETGVATKGGYVAFQHTDGQEVYLEMLGWAPEGSQ